MARNVSAAGAVQPGGTRPGQCAHVHITRHLRCKAPLTDLAGQGRHEQTGHGRAGGPVRGAGAGAAEPDPLDARARMVFTPDRAGLAAAFEAGRWRRPRAEWRPRWATPSATVVSIRLETYASGAGLKRALGNA